MRDYPREFQVSVHRMYNLFLQCPQTEKYTYIRIKYTTMHDDDWKYLLFSDFFNWPHHPK